jgi:hypothetical protein
VLRVTLPPRVWLLVQIFGGNGFNTAYPVEKLMRDAKIYQIYEVCLRFPSSIVLSRGLHCVCCSTSAGHVSNPAFDCVT